MAKITKEKEPRYIMELSEKEFMYLTTIVGDRTVEEDEEAGLSRAEAQELYEAMREKVSL